jgi:hypothetical protein
MINNNNNNNNNNVQHEFRTLLVVVTWPNVIFSENPGHVSPHGFSVQF